MAEAAIVLPVFFLIVFGVIEHGILFKEALTVDDIARTGARAATAAGNDGDADHRMLSAVKAAATALDPGQLERIVIYKASGPSDSLDANNASYASCRAGTPVAGVCNVYAPSDLSRPSGDFGCQAGISPDRFWCPTDRKIAQTGAAGPPDWVGVWVRATHNSLTGLVSNDRVITNSLVLRIEPRLLS